MTFRHFCKYYEKSTGCSSSDIQTELRDLGKELFVVCYIWKRLESLFCFCCTAMQTARCASSPIMNWGGNRFFFYPSLMPSHILNVSQQRNFVVKVVQRLTWNKKTETPDCCWLKWCSISSKLFNHKFSFNLHDALFCQYFMILSNCHSVFSSPRMWWPRLCDCIRF